MEENALRRPDPPPDPERRLPESTLLHVAFFASGAAALIYEILWMRRLTLFLGATAAATAVTLSALFLGMGLGSAIFGALTPRARRPLRIFGAMEAGIALGALCVEPILALTEGVLVPGSAASHPAMLSARMALAAASILAPAVLMGGSLPVLAQAIDRGHLGLGVLGGGLYAANTIGAAAGAIAVPALLLPAWGSAGTLAFALGLSLTIAAVALSLDAARAVPSGARTAPHATRPPADNLLTLAALFSGAVLLALQVLWTRMLALVHENSVHSFATVVAVFLIGIAAGAAGVRALLRRGIAPRTIAGAGWIGAGLWVVATPVLFRALTSGFRYVRESQGLLRHEIAIASLALATLFPAAVLAGAALPALMEARGRAPGGSAASNLGWLLAANTAGGIAGPLLAVFVVGPVIGLWWGMVLCGVLMLVAGDAALRGRPDRGRLSGRLAWYAAGAAVLWLAQPGNLPRVRLEPGERLVDLREGAFGTIAVVEAEGQRRLMLNNYYVLGGTASAGEERLQAHIPLLLHPSPRRVAFLGLGTGITAGAALYHPVQEVSAMELVPEAVTAAREHFGAANLRVLDDPRVSVFVQDARTHLRAVQGRFDVIVGDLVVPWRRGEAALYTQESFASARRALAPDGLFCQWVPLFQISRREFDSIAATFLDVFPRTVLFRGDFRAGEPAVGLVGLTSEHPLDPAGIDARSESLARRPDAANPYLAHPAGLWAYLVGPLSPADPAFLAAPRSRDDRPIVELHSLASQLSGSAGGAFVRDELRSYFDVLRFRPLAGTPLERLDDAHRLWRDAGADIWRASLLDLEGHHEAADALGLAAIDRLPDPLRHVLRSGGLGP